MITLSLELMIGRDNPDKNIAIKRNDSGVRLKVYLKKAHRSKYRTIGEPYNIPPGAYAILKVEKIDKKVVLQKGKCQGTAALFELNPQALTVVGKNPAEINIYGTDGRRITSATFYIEVLKELGEGCTEDSETFVDILNEQLQRAEAAAEKAVSASVNPPKLSEADTWLIWDFEKGGYIDTGMRGGAPGASAYEIAVQNGFKGTEKEWLESLKAAISPEEVKLKTDKTLKINEAGELSVNTAETVEEDNTLPISSAAVHTIVGNIDILLGTL